MKYIIIVMVMLLLSGCNGIKNVDKSEFFNIKNNNIEVYEEVYLQDLLEMQVTDKNFQLISDNYRIDTNTIGKKKYEVLYQVNNKKYRYEFNVEVVDTEMPRVFSGTNKTVNVNYEGDLCNLITYGDNYDGDILCEITGDYDLSKPGTYKLIYNLSDKSNNLKEVNVTLNVKEKSNEEPSTPPKKENTLFTDVYTNYKSDTNEIGIDVSKWQGDIDFNKVKEAGATFVMIRMGVQKEVKGDLFLDEYFKDNLKKAKDAGLKVGIYLYSIATSSSEATEQANWVLKNLDGENLDLPIVFDWESWSKWNSFKISFHEINSIASNYMSTIKNGGYDAMLYSSKFYLEDIWTNKLNYPVWLAHYTKETSYEGDYLIWQMCNNGKIEGINGDVDIDIMYH